MLRMSNKHLKQKYDKLYDAHHDQHVQGCRHCEHFRDSVAKTPAFVHLFSSFCVSATILSLLLAISSICSMINNKRSTGTSRCKKETTEDRT